MKNYWLCLVVVALLAPARVDADVWDVNTNNDNTSATTRNQLVHGTRQLHDLGALAPPAPDQDWYLITVPAHSSYEIVVDSTSGDINPEVTRLTQALTPVQSAVGIGIGYSKRLAFSNPTGTSATYFIFVGNAACSTSCGADDVYSISVQETTIGIARFNNNGSQITVLLTQNVAEVPINATVLYFSVIGTVFTSSSLAGLGAKNLSVVNTSSVTPNLTGHIVIVHDGPYGGLNAKTVALEPTTGFSFDTPGVYRGF